MYSSYLKPLLDFLISLILILISFPIILIIAILSFINNGGKVFFIQKRPGKNEQIFSLYKFKTMNDKKDNNGNLLPDEKRLTKIGKIIRKFSLDELLQFINVLKGDMSLIGPRPLLIEYLPLYNEHQKKRHNVKPGITGWAQVNGRNAISWEDKFNLDVWYVENVSFILDIKIFIMTIMKIFKSDGISSSTSATMEKFKGN
ncbi:MAG: sugar transferase [Ignavibacteriales bacterium]|nr:sugar transferase [Ignavibacteriales bacterium]